MLAAQNEVEEADKYCRQVIQWRKAQLGAEHVDTLVSVNNLAVLHQTMGKPDEAELVCHPMPQENENSGNKGSEPQLPRPCDKKPNRQSAPACMTENNKVCSPSQDQPCQEW